MSKPEPEALARWLDEVQHYPVDPANARRLADGLAAVSAAQLTVLRSAAPESLFWTEPSNFAAALSRLAWRGVGDE